LVAARSAPPHSKEGIANVSLIRMILVRPCHTI